MKLAGRHHQLQAVLSPDSLAPPDKEPTVPKSAPEAEGLGIWVQDTAWTSCLIGVLDPALLRCHLTLDTLQCTLHRPGQVAEHTSHTLWGDTSLLFKFLLKTSGCQRADILESPSTTQASYVQGSI